MAPYREGDITDQGSPVTDDRVANNMLLDDMKKWFKNMLKYDIEFKLYIPHGTGSLEEAMSSFESKIEKHTNYIFLIDELEYEGSIKYSLNDIPEVNILPENL